MQRQGASASTTVFKDGLIERAIGIFAGQLGTSHQLTAYTNTLVQAIRNGPVSTRLLIRALFIAVDARLPYMTDAERDQFDQCVAEVSKTITDQLQPEGRYDHPRKRGRQTTMREMKALLCTALTNRACVEAATHFCD